jgi:hypothetical protein
MLCTVHSVNLHSINRYFFLQACVSGRMARLAAGCGSASVVQGNAQERSIDLEAAIVFDESKLPEFVHEKIDPRPRGANHLRKHLLRYFGEHLLSLACFAIMCQ